ncbi:MAG: hypothetical protein E6R13_02955 [Spirochaetes bacterium]|nr:MAG: hypothetical protein E6R13_02955 [Spirochaetota bacterium]
MPQVYNGGQSPLEFYAINGNPMYPGTGRLALINQSAIGTSKYAFQGPYKNPDITGNLNDAYGATNTNAISDNLSPYNGRGTGDGITNGVFGAITNYNGGNQEDRLGSMLYAGSGRNPQVTLNAGVWGYGPSQIAGSNYVSPNTALNVGQVVI